MTLPSSSPIRLPRWRLLSPQESRSLASWSSSLHSPTAHEIEAARHLGLARRWLDLLPDDWFEHVRRAMGEVWCGGRRERLAIELRIHHRGGPSAVECSDPIVRIGSARGCHVALTGEVAPEHCELRAEEGSWYLVDLGAGETRLDGQPIEPHARHPLDTGDVFRVGDFEIEVAAIGMQESAPRVAVMTREILAPSELDRVLSSQPIEWVDLRVGDWDCFVRLDTSWTRFAYKTLGYPLPDESVDLGNEVDCGVTLFVVERIVDEIRRRTDMTLECRGTVPSALVRTDARGEPLRWVTGIFEVRLEDEAVQIVLLWPWKTLGEIPLPLGWVRKLDFPVSVIGGTTRLSPTDLAGLEVGDVLLPDRWSLEASPDGSAVGGPVHLRLQDWDRLAELRATPSGHGLVIKTVYWNRSPEGVLMPSDQVEPIDQEAEEPSPRPIEEELELTLAFELDRVSVPLGELTEWQEGSTVMLKRSPDDAIRVLLQHGGGSKVVGSGRVVQVEGQLGVRLEEWWPQSEEPARE